MIGEGLIKRNDGVLPPNVRKLLSKVGDENIEKIKIVRYPIKLSKIFNLISLGTYQTFIKKFGLDKLFHLSLYINDKYVIEKNQVINMEVDNPLSVENAESLDVSVNNKITFNELLEKTKALMGDKNFTNYNARNNNCQVFITSILKSNSLLNSENNDFINQDVEQILSAIPVIAEKFVNTATETAAFIDRQQQGEGSISNFGNVPYTHGVFQHTNLIF
jgi:hypothetical protein